MGDAYRGLTIRIGADAQPLNRVLSHVSSAARTTSREVARISKALNLEPGNANLMNLKIRALGDQSKAAATQIVRMRQALDQTLSKYKGGKSNLSTMLKDAETNAARFRTEFNTLDRTLQTGYDRLISFKEASEGLSHGDAVKAVKRLREEARHSAEAMKQLETQLRAAWTAAKSSGGTLPFGAKSVDEAIAKWKALIAAQKEAQRQLGFANEFTGVKNLVVDLEIAETELRQMCREAINARNALQQMGTTTGAKNASNQQRLLAESTKEAERALQSAMNVTRLIPKNIKAATEQARSFEQVSRLLNQQIQLLQAKLKTLDGTKIERIERSYVTTGNAVRVLTEREARLASEVEKVSGEMLVLQERMNAAGEVTAEFQKCESEVRELGVRLEALNKKLVNVRSSLRTANEAHAFRETETELTALNGKLAAHEAMIARAKRKWGQFGATMRTAGYSMTASLGGGAFIAGMYAVQSAKDIDTAYRNMRKTVNGTEEQFVQLRKAALDFSQTHFTSADQILEIEAIGGQLGIQVQNLERFAEVVSNTDIATNLDTETISQNLGQLTNIMNDMDQSLQKGPGSMAAYSDSLVRLGNNTAAQEDKIQNVMMRIASMGTICNMSTPDLLALASATAATGQGAEAAGTALSKTFSGIESAVNGSERALSKLQNSSDLTEEEIEDLTKVIENGQLKLEKFAEVAGMSAEDFKRAWNGDNVMQDAFVPFIEGLKRIDQEGGSVDSTLVNLGITSVRQKQTLQGLTQTVGILGNALTMSNDAWNGVSDQWGAAGDAAREAQRKAEGFSGQLEMLKNNAKVLGSELLESLTPALSRLVDIARGAANAFKELPDGLKQTTVGFGALAALSGPVMIFAGTALSAGSSLKSFFTGQRQGWSLAKKALDDGSDALSITTTMIGRNGEAVKKGAGLAERFGTKIFDAGSKVSEMGSKAGKAGGLVGKLGSGLQGAGLAATSLSGHAFLATAAIGMIAIAIGAAVAHVDEMKKREEKLAKATETMSDRISLSFDNVSKKADSVFKADIKGAFDYYEEYVNKAAERNEELGKSADTLIDNLSRMRFLQSDINELLEKLNDAGDLDANEFSLLAQSITDYNQITGESISVTRDESGKIKVLKDNVDLTAQAFANLAKQKELSAKADYFQKEYNTAYENSMDVRIGYQKTKAARDELERKLEERKKSGNYATKAVEIKMLENDLAKANAELEVYEGNLKTADETMGQATKATELLNSELATQEGTIENLIASSDAYTAALVTSKGNLSDFKAICEKAGIGADKLKRVDLEKVFNEWDGSMGNLLSTLKGMGVDLGEAEAELMKLKMLSIGDKHYFIDDDGSIQWQEGQLHDLEALQIGDKHYYVTDDGAVYDQQGLCEGFNSFKIYDKLYIVSDDGSISTQEGKLKAVQGLKIDDKEFFVTAEGLVTAEGELHTFDKLQIDPKEYLVEDGDSVRVEKDKLESLRKKLMTIPATVTTKAQLDDSDIMTKLSRVKEAIASIGGNISTRLTSSIGNNATGGFKKMARPNVALHAAGAFITKGTTYIGSDKKGVHHIAGEAGREFVQRHADGTTSIIPLQNRKYMAPFVAAVADMLPDGRGGSVSKEDLYKVADAVIKSNRQQGDIVLIIDDREVARAVRKYA